MDKPILRVLIREKLAHGRLPHDHAPRMRSRPGNGGTCDGCEETVTESQGLMENLDARGGRVYFHIACFYLWDVERQMYGQRHRPLPLLSRASRAN
jgi:hypothetical protein